MMIGEDDCSYCIIKVLHLFLCFVSACLLRGVLAFFYDELMMVGSMDEGNEIENTIREKETKLADRTV